jgi:class 3 adenylate cyclase
MSGRQLAKGKDFVFAERGEVSLKGFDEPVRLYEMRWREKD